MANPLLPLGSGVTGTFSAGSVTGTVNCPRDGTALTGTIPIVPGANGLPAAVTLDTVCPTCSAHTLIVVQMDARIQGTLSVMGTV